MNTKIKKIVINDKELETVTGGMKVVVEEKEELSWWQTIVNFLTKTY